MQNKAEMLAYIEDLLANFDVKKIILTPSSLSEDLSPIFYIWLKPIFHSTSS